MHIATACMSINIGSRLHLLSIKVAAMWHDVDSLVTNHQEKLLWVHAAKKYSSQISVVALLSSLNCRDINNGVYRAGFAKSQEAYDKAVRDVFRALDQVEEILSHHRYLVGSQMTEADVRLYTTLVRFDLVYVGVFRVSSITFTPKIWFSGQR